MSWQLFFQLSGWLGRRWRGIRVYLGIIYGESRQIPSKYVLETLLKVFNNFLDVVDQVADDGYTWRPGDHLRGIGTNYFIIHSSNFVEGFSQFSRRGQPGRQWRWYLGIISRESWQIVLKYNLEIVLRDFDNFINLIGQFDDNGYTWGSSSGNLGEFFETITKKYKIKN